MRNALYSILLLFFATSVIFAQENKEEADSLVRLINAKKIQLVEIDGQACRRVEGPATFLHNDTYLICDTAFWNVDKDYIDAINNVRIIQENTMLTGDRLHYIVGQNLAQFRGALVELKDEKQNTLRTNNLDYNTKDSIAYFYDGASMQDEDGNIIESVRGRYESKGKLFTFIEDVQMFSDSLFFVTDTARYRTDLETAYFTTNTKAWKNQNYFSATGGWYNRGDETMFFEGNVYGQTEDYELWCDDLFFNRNEEHTILRGNVQVTDTINGAVVLGDHIETYNEPRSAKVTINPAIIGLVEEDGVSDSVYVAADTLYYYSRKMFEVDSSVIAQAKERKKLAMIDAVFNLREQIKAEQAALNQRQVDEEMASRGGGKLNQIKSGGNKLGEEGVENEVVEENDEDDGDDENDGDDEDEDTPSEGETIATPQPKDTSDVVFLEAYHNVRIYKSDNQVICDSLLYSGIDSIARLFKSPVIWNEVTNQLSSDSIQVVMKDGAMEKGLLLSNAFVAFEEQPGKYYNQVKSPEMAGFFKDGELARFDALGGAQMLMYLKDSTEVAYANRKECKIISSELQDGTLQKNFYFEGIKSNIFPIEDLPKDEMNLNGFVWRGGERPVDRYAITPRGVRESIRQYTLESPYYPLFPYTSHYFPGYIENIMEQIIQREPWKWKSSKE